MPRIVDLLRERHPGLLGRERRAYRWLQSARDSRSDRTPLAEAQYQLVRRERIQAENQIRAELALPLLEVL